VVTVSPFRRALEPRRLVAILAALGVCLTLLPGATLCVGSDGHLAVEAIGSDCGTPSAGTPERGPGGATVPGFEPDGAQPGHGGIASLHGCTDTALGVATLLGHSDPGRREMCVAARTLVALASDARGDDVAAAPVAPSRLVVAARSPVLQL